MFDINYVKNKKSNITTTLEGITKIQNYIPIYKNFFSLNDTNYNNINLNNRYHVSHFIQKESDNKYMCHIKSDTQQSKVSSFLKYSPLVDPIKYMAGKYKDTKIDILPTLNGEKEGHRKIRDGNNSAYVDGFFSFLSSKALNDHRFLHGVDFYGSFLAIKKNFKYNIIDDIEYLHQSDYFHKHNEKLFKVDNNYEEIFDDANTRHYRKRLKMCESLKSLQRNTFGDEKFSTIFDSANVKKDISENIIFTSDISHNELHNTTASTKSSACSSRSSHTSHGSSDSSGSYGSHTTRGSGSSSSVGDSLSTCSDDMVNASLFNFPVQIICLEALDDTLDSILTELEAEELRSCFFQIIMMLLVYQKMFDLTHNDLHTNNIMYKETQAKYLYYYYNSKYYKVPTYGKIYKIIDFGRAIYKFKGNIICSDSFHPKGDAATQYNCVPYFNKNKPRLDPNKSFDLCRLGCSLFDFFFDEEHDDIDKINDPMAQLVHKWCKDDKGRNILYKKNGDERYPEFKLYKMIARNVHHCTPEKEIQNNLFNKFISSRKKVKKNRVFNVDTLPSYIN